MKEQIRRGIRIVIIMALLAALIPAVAALVFSIRYLVFALIPLGVALFFLVPALRRFFAEPAGAVCLAGGFRLPPGFYVHAGHGWARVSGRGKVLVGADDFMQRLLGPVESIAVPRAGDKIKQGEEFARLRSAGRSVGVRAPIAGMVEAVNPKIDRDPNLINREPFGEGWIARVTPENLDAGLAGLAVSGKAFDWMRGEVEKLRTMLSPHSAPSQVLQDGGEFVDNLHENVDDEQWERIRRSFFENRGEGA